MAKTTTPIIVLGTAFIGDASDPQAKYTTPAQAQSFINIFKSHSHTVLDNARAYSPGAPGSSEALLGQTDFASWAIVDTKVKSFGEGSHSAAGIAESIDGSLEALKVDKVRIMYLHAPDRSTPFAETCEAMDKGFRAGKFEEFGLSNFAPEEVEEVVKICGEKGWVKPTVYQGQYNAVCRKGEEGLFPVLRKNGIRFYAYRYVLSSSEWLVGSITNDGVQSKRSRLLFWKGECG